MLELARVVPSSWFDRTDGAVIVMALGVVVPLVLFAWSLVQIRRSLRRARLYSSPRTHADRLGAEGFVAIAGRVVASDGDDAPEWVVQTEVVQLKRLPNQRGPAWYLWREIDRTVVAHPFDVALDDGTVVHVDAGERSALCADLSLVAEDSSLRRRRIARVAVGDRVTVTGDLARDGGGTTAYREGARPYTLRAPRDGRVVVATVDRVRESHRASLFRGLTVALFSGVVIALHAGVFANFEQTALRGEVVMADLTWPTVRTEWHSSRRGSYADHRWFANAVWRDDRGRLAHLSGEVDASAYDQVLAACRDASVDQPARMPFVVVRSDPRFHVAGRSPALPNVAPWTALALWIASIVLGAAIVHAATPWYAGRRVNDSLRF